MRTQASLTVWRDDKDRTLTLYVGYADSHTTVVMDKQRARRLIRELEKELDKLPATVTAADLGIAAE
jgi:hypothetical protein